MPPMGSRAATSMQLELLAAVDTIVWCKRTETPLPQLAQLTPLPSPSFIPRLPSPSIRTPRLPV